MPAHAADAPATVRHARAEPSPDVRSVTIADLEVRGVEATPVARVLDVLRAEGLEKGATLLWPEDMRVQRAGSRETMIVVSSPW